MKYILQDLDLIPDEANFGTIFKGSFTAKRKDAILKYFAVLFYPKDDISDFISKLRKLADVLENYSTKRPNKGE